MGNVCSCIIKPKKSHNLFKALMQPQSQSTSSEKCQFVLLDKEANKLLYRRMNEKNADFTEKQSILLMGNLIDVGLRSAEKTIDKD